jgi:hypothetical protein
MKERKTRKYLKAARKLAKKIRKHGKDGERLLAEIKKLFEASRPSTKPRKAVRKTVPELPGPGAA